MKKKVVIIDNFYDDPDAIVDDAINFDYKKINVNNSEEGESSWLVSSRQTIIIRAESLTKIESNLDFKIDKSHWEHGTSHNGCFHFYNRGLNYGVYNFKNQKYNYCGVDGYIVIVILNKNAIDKPLLDIWEHPKYIANNSWNITNDVMKSKKIASVANIYNRAIVVPSDTLYFGFEGWGTDSSNSRLVQTFFLRKKGSYIFDKLSSDKSRGKVKIEN